MQDDVMKKLEALEKKTDDLYRSVEKMRKYFLWTLIGTIVLFVLPLIGLMFALPPFLETYIGNLNSLGV